MLLSFTKFFAKNLYQNQLILNQIHECIFRFFLWRLLLLLLPIFVIERSFCKFCLHNLFECLIFWISLILNCIFALSSRILLVEYLSRWFHLSRDHIWIFLSETFLGLVWVKLCLFFVCYLDKNWWDLLKKGR